jgi:mono/diheme cytochrome c family protein
MRRSTLNFALFLALLAVFGLDLALRPDPGERNVDFVPEMVTSVAAEPFSASPVFADGKTLQTPPAGAIVRGRPPLHYQATPADAARAGRELSNPFPAADAKAVARGATVYANYCQVCHGPAGKGDGPVAQRGFPAPPSLLAERAVGLPDGQIFHILTYGQGNMPPYAMQIGREDRWLAVLHVRELQRTARTTRTARTMGETR